MAVGGLLAFGRLAAIFAGPEFGRLLYQQYFAAKSQATPPANLNALRPFIAVEWEGLVAVQIRRTFHTFCRRQEAVAKKPPLIKMMFELNRWAANSPTHMNEYFSGHNMSSNKV
jgi:hypothetical protein